MARLQFRGAPNVDDTDNGPPDRRATTPASVTCGTVVDCRPSPPRRQSPTAEVPLDVSIQSDRADLEWPRRCPATIRHRRSDKVGRSYGTSQPAQVVKLLVQRNVDRPRERAHPRTPGAGRVSTTTAPRAMSAARGGFQRAARVACAVRRKRGPSLLIRFISAKYVGGSGCPASTASTNCVLGHARPAPSSRFSHSRASCWARRRAPCRRRSRRRGPARAAGDSGSCLNALQAAIQRPRARLHRPDDLGRALEQIGTTDIAGEDEVAREDAHRHVGRRGVRDHERQMLGRVSRRVQRAHADVADHEVVAVGQQHGAGSPANAYCQSGPPRPIGTASRRSAPPARGFRSRSPRGCASRSRA